MGSAEPRPGRGSVGVVGVLLDIDLDGPVRPDASPRAVLRFGEGDNMTDGSVGSVGSVRSRGLRQLARTHRPRSGGQRPHLPDSPSELPARPADRRAGASFCRGRRLQRAISSGAHRRAAATAAASLNARSGFPGLPALRRAHGPPHGAQRRSGRVAVLGMHRLPGMPWNPAGGRIGRIAPIGRIARIHSDVIACPRGRIGNCDCEFPGSCAR